MTPRKRLSTAIRQAAQSAADYQRSQDELHSAFFNVYGFDLDLEELKGDEWVDALVYGMGMTPMLADFDRAVVSLRKAQEEQSE